MDKLTRRQREILELIAAEGLSYKEIAYRLRISRQTVKNHMINIYDRLRLERRTAIQAILRGLLEE